MNDTTSHEIVRLAIDAGKPSVTLETDWIFLGSLMLFTIIIIIVKRRYFKHLRWQSLEVEISGSPKAVFKVERNDENLYIANRIYIELTTRKAAIPIDESNDVIEEIYDSWYNLFGIIRDELKALPGKYLKDHDPTLALIGVTRKILNDALRPHLTEHQSRFRQWLESAKSADENKNLSPQELQQKYPHFNELVVSMKAVNETLIKYAEELNKLIKGK